jgi:di/tripeptidase
MREFRSAAERTVGSVLKKNVQPVAASTDANIPLSMGIPAVAFGTVSGAGLHTRDEWIDKASLMTGQELAIRFALDRSGVI